MTDTAASHRSIDQNGFLTVRSTPVSSYGIFEYSAAQVGLPGDPNRIVNVYRPESSLTDPDAIVSFQTLPLIDDHDLLSGFEEDEDVMSPEDKGVDGVMTNVRYVAPWLIADIKIFSRRMRRAIDSGKCDLSAGYGCDFIIQSGTFEGKPYEVMQINMRGNHLALVDAGRVPGARVMDSKTLVFDCLSFNKVNPTKGIDMKKPRKSVAMDNAVEQLKSLIPALEQYLSEEASEPAHQDTPAAAPAAAAPVEGGLGETPAVEGDEEGAEPIAEAPAAAAPAEAAPAEAPAAAPAGGPAEILTKIKALLESMGAPAPAAVDGEEPPVAEDGGLEGLQEEGSHAIGADEEEPAGAAQDCEGNGNASAGPAAGVHSAGDAAIRKSIYKDMANKDKLYNRVKPVIGAFDHALMTCEDLAVYAAKKLKINAPKGSAAVALDSFLSGVERSKVATTKPVTNACDASFGTFDPIDQYLKGN